MTSSLTFNSGIQALAYRLGSRREQGADLVHDNPDWKIDDIEVKTGVATRHVAGPQETASDMAAAAAEELFEGGVDRASIDALIFVTQSPDYFLPTTACLLQDRLGLSKKCLAFDVNQGCSGFVYGLGISASLIHSELARHVLLLCGDTYTRYIRPDDRTCRPIFSDGAAASLIAAGHGASMGSFVFGSDGSGGHNLIVKNGAARDFPAHDAAVGRQIHMNGPQVFTFTMSAVPKLVASILESAQMTLDAVDVFIFHQASALVLGNIARQLKLPAEKFYSNLRDVGNTVSASIPVAMASAVAEGRLRAGDKVMVCGFGVGYSWAGALIEWGTMPPAPGKP